MKNARNNVTQYWKIIEQIMKPKTAPTLHEWPLNISEVLKNRDGQIRIAWLMAPVICAIFGKISSAFDSHSRINLPNGRSLCYSSHDEYRVVYRCWANMKITIPYEFIQDINDWTIENINHMIWKWEFSLDGMSIPPELWCDNPHYNAKKYATEVPRKVSKALDKDWTEPKTRLSSGIMGTLLPPIIPKSVSNESSNRGVPKLRKTEFVKSPELIIKKRENV